MTQIKKKDFGYRLKRKKPDSTIFKNFISKKFRK